MDEKTRRLTQEFHNSVLDHVQQNLRKYYENSFQTEMVKIATRAEFDRSCESIAKNISKAEVKRWINENIPLEQIHLTQKMLTNIEQFVDKKMSKRPSLV